MSLSIGFDLAQTLQLNPDITAMIKCPTRRKSDAVGPQHMETIKADEVKCG